MSHHQVGGAINNLGKRKRNAQVSGVLTGFQWLLFCALKVATFTFITLESVLVEPSWDSSRSVYLYFLQRLVGVEAPK